jgi:predicted restriction endonuclease
MTNPIIKYIDEKINEEPIFLIYDKLIQQHNKNDIKFVLITLYNINIETLEKIEYDYKEKRQYQQLLREAVIKKYNGKCIISGCDRLKCLECAHIKPVNECIQREKCDVNNALLLWIDLHKYFDNYDFSINPKTYLTEVNEKCIDYKWLKEYENIKVELSKENITYVQHHYNKFLSI